MKYWTNKVTLYSLCGKQFKRAGVLEGCFWKRSDSLIYEEGRRLECAAFVCRVPYGAVILPGDVMVLGDTDAEITPAFMAENADRAFCVSASAAHSAPLEHTKVTGTNVR